LKFTSKSTNITEEDQNMLWDLPHSATDHNPGKLALCIGMPVMIRHNDATELCITKGQEGTVAAWQSHEGPYGIADIRYFICQTHKSSKCNQI
jgi:hypothetical protein